MITIKLQNINNIICPETPIPFPNFGTFSSNGYINICETEAEYQQFIIPLTAPTLDEVKKIKLEEISNTTDELILNGFDYQGMKFSLAPGAQSNLHHIKVAEPSEFPFNYMSLSYEIYVLQFDERDLFYNTAVTKTREIKEEGGIIEFQVNSLTTINDVLNFKDPRK